LSMRTKQTPVFVPRQLARVTPRRTIRDASPSSAVFIESLTPEGAAEKGNPREVLRRRPARSKRDRYAAAAASSTHR